MVDPITPKQLLILQIVAKHPEIARERILQLPGATEADIKYLEMHDMIREREIGCYRIAHFGERVLNRGR